MRFLKRFWLAALLIAGRVEMPQAPSGSSWACVRRHLAGDEAPVKKERLSALERAADELKIARGVIAGLGKQAEFGEMVRNTLGK